MGVCLGLIGCADKTGRHTCTGRTGRHRLFCLACEERIRAFQACTAVSEHLAQEEDFDTPVLPKPDEGRAIPGGRPLPRRHPSG